MHGRKHTFYFQSDLKTSLLKKDYVHYKKGHDPESEIFCQL